MRNTKKRGFALVEMLIVIVVIGIIMALILLSGSATRTVETQTEARQLIRAVQSLRSGYLSYYADKHELLGIPGTAGVIGYGPNDPFVKSLEIYLDRPLRDDIARYGNVLFGIHTVTPRNVTTLCIGFDTNPADNGGKLGGTQKANALEALDKVATDYGLLNRNRDTFTSSNQDGVMLRIR